MVGAIYTTICIRDRNISSTLQNHTYNRGMINSARQNSSDLDSFINSKPIGNVRIVDMEGQSKMSPFRFFSLEYTKKVKGLCLFLSVLNA
ncbi:hypothetical protein AQUCO_00100563v1 [Aquilegia coerulea]|uniref:Uncharacterized protein n=1 Tax=Aquilegia coerulea TaxID=218851 RepID=A0A2G5FB80_AQUCA|nr:hypothetical protein AQUCO_00100563v1 [Aquilegia coerulea]